ncbi:MAG: peptide chain release factor N(5)-glutamine methyltransferase [Bdellovibrionales bacterium]|nr:peptide chain release factor N(5)-glutamine methyltransferase [Bdellovibrionales bacterium]
MTVAQFVEETHFQFKQINFIQPRTEAELLVAGILNWPRIHLMTRETELLSSAQWVVLDRGRTRRLQGEPLAYILGEKNFYKSSFVVGPGVLIPRPETEIVVETVLKLTHGLRHHLKVADFGAGSGCIGLSLLLEQPLFSLMAVESSDEAIRYLNKNINKFHLYNRVQVLPRRVERLSQFVKENEFDLIVANPPYIAKDDPSVEKAVREYEPPAALFSPDQGFGAMKSWLEMGIRLLKNEGYMVMEIGSNQESQVKQFAEHLGWEFLYLQKDLAGLPRVVTLKKIEE